MFKKENSDSYYFYSFFHSRNNVLYKKLDPIKLMAFSDQESFIFLVKDDEQLIINNLGDLFP